MIEIRRAFTGELLLNLQAESLEGAQLREANLRGADLVETNLRRADLSGAALRAAEMNDCNLEEANLHGANLLLANLRRAKLQSANLQSANLEGASLFRADLRGANLQGAILFGALLTHAVYDYETQWPAGMDPLKHGAKLVKLDDTVGGMPKAEKTPCPSCGKEIHQDALKCRYCGNWLNKATEKDSQGIKILGPGGEVLRQVQAQTLEGADLSGAKLSGANLVNVNLRKAILRGVDLSRAALRGANLEGAILLDANLSGANLRHANLTGAEMSGAMMKGTSLEDADLTKAVLTRANLREANLSGATVRDTDFFNANLFGVNFARIKQGETAIWPVEFNPLKRPAPLPASGDTTEPGAATPVPAPQPAIPSVIETSSYRPAPTPAIEQIQCPFCAETILADAIKCRFCGEWLVQVMDEAEKSKWAKTKLYLISGVVVLTLIVIGSGAALFLPAFQFPPTTVSSFAPTAGSPADSPSGQRYLNFPSDHSIGNLAARDWGSTDTEAWRNVAEAQGKTPVPSGKELKLIVNETATDLRALDSFGPADLHTLDLLLASFKDDQLIHLKGLTGLKELYLPPQTTDTGLIGLKPLTSLTTLILFDTKITDAGLERLTGLKTLQFLYLPKQIGDKPLQDLQKTLPGCSIKKY